MPGVAAGKRFAGVGGRRVPGLVAGKQFAGVDAGQARIHARPAGARLRNPLLISFNGSSPSGLWAVWATRSVVQASGGRPQTLPGQSLSPDAAPSTARVRLTTRKAAKAAGNSLPDDPE